MGKSTISMTIFNSKVLVFCMCTRGYHGVSPWWNITRRWQASWQWIIYHEYVWIWWGASLVMGRKHAKTIYLRHACTLEPCHVASGTRECQSDVAHDRDQQTSISLLALIHDSVCSLIWIATTLFSQPKNQGRWSQVTDTAQLSSSQDIWCTMSALRSSHQGGVGFLTQTIPTWSDRWRFLEGNNRHIWRAIWRWKWRSSIEIGSPLKFQTHSMPQWAVKGNDQSFTDGILCPGSKL